MSAEQDAARVQPPSRRARARYAFDNAMARGSAAIVALLLLAIVVVVVVFTIVLVALGVGPGNPITLAYDVLLQVIDAGGTEEPGAVASVMFLGIAIVGILIFGAFIGALVTGMDARLERLRQGRSLVLERDHTLVLGWSERVFTILSELSIANESRERPSVVILAERPKSEMEDAIRERVPDMRNTRVVCRTGNPVVAADLDLVNHHQARAVIVLGRDEDDDPDADVIKTLLALTNGARGRPADGARGHGTVARGRRNIVAEVQEAATARAAALLEGDDIALINKPQTVGRLIVQTSRQSGAAAVYREILDFASSEIYMRRDDDLTGLTVLDAALGYRDCTFVGLMDAGGVIELNPPGGRLLKPDDTIIALAEDDSVLDAVRYERAATDPDIIAVTARPPEGAEATLVIGYNRRTAIVVGALATYAMPGSRALVVSDVPVDEAALRRDLAGPLAVQVQSANTTERAVLERLDIAAYDRVIVMSYSDDLSPKRAAARALLTLLHLRDIADASRRRLTIVSEILAQEDTDLVKIAGVNDIVVSDEILSLLLTQVAENHHLAGVFHQLFQAAGSEVYLRPVEGYVSGGPVSFATLVQAASQRAETAIGYWAADDGEQTQGITVNPSKQDLFPAAPGDRLIVLAEE